MPRFTGNNLSNAIVTVKLTESAKSIFLAPNAVFDFFANDAEASDLITQLNGLVSSGLISYQASNGFDIPGSPFPTTPTVITIYARMTGSNTTGDGTLAKPYRTMQRAVRDVPVNIAAGVSYIVDISGTSTTLFTETTPLDYELPSWKAPETLKAIYSGITPHPHFVFGTAIALSATPRLTTLLSVADATIASTEILSQVTASANNGHGLVTLTINSAPRAAWAGNALKGKVLLGNVGIQSAMIEESTSTTLVLSISAAIAGTTLTIMEPSAHIITSSTSDAATARGGLNAINCDSISFNGLKITTTTGNLGLAVTGQGAVAVQNCELQNAALLVANVDKTRFSRCWFYGTLRCAADSTIQACLLDGLTSLIFQAPGVVHLRQTIVSGCPPIKIANTSFPGITANTVFGPLDFFQMDNVWIKNTPGVTGDGIVFYGLRGRLINVGIDGCGRDAIRCETGPGSLELNNVRTLVANGVAAAGLGLNIVEGQFNVKPNAATSGATATTSQLRGGAGDMKVGTLAARTWADFVTPGTGRPALQEVDITGDLLTGITGTTSSVRQ